MLFRIKAGLARSVAVLSRISGRGGGTTLPGKLLLRMQPDAHRPAGGAASRRLGVDLGHQRQDHHAKMAAVDPVPEPDRLPQRLGRQPGLRRGLRAARRRRRRPRPVRGGRGGAAGAWPDALTPSRGGARATSSATSSTATASWSWWPALARDGSRAAAPSSMLVCNADDPLVASIGRGREHTTWFGHRRPRGRRWAEMQHAADSKWCVRCGHRYAYDSIYARPPRRLALPELRRRAPAARRGRPRDPARRPRRGLVPALHAAGRGARAAAAAGALQRLQRARRRRSGARAGRACSRRAGRAGAVLGRLRPLRADHARRAASRCCCWSRTRPAATR